MTARCRNRLWHAIAVASGRQAFPCDRVRREEPQVIEGERAQAAHLPNRNFTMRTLKVLQGASVLGEG